MIRLAAVGDLHVGVGSAGTLRPALAGLPAHADVLLLAGDLTDTGDPAEAHVVAEEVRDLGVPVVAVLGNHDHHRGAGAQVGAILVAAGVTVLEGQAVLFDIAGVRLGVAGVHGRHRADGAAGGSAGSAGSAGWMTANAAPCGSARIANRP